MSMFVGELDSIDRVDIDKPISNVAVRWPMFYAELYRESAKSAQEQGRFEDEGVYRFLEQLLSMMPTFDQKDQPYSPYASGHGFRSEIPSDCSPVDIQAVEKLIGRTTDVTLLAHLNDLLFVGPTRNHQAGLKAAPLFLEVGKALAGTNNPVYMKDALKRGIQLARQMGWRKTLGDNARSTLSELIKAGSRAPFDADLLYCLQLAQEEGIGDRKELRDIAMVAGEHHKKEGATEDAKHFFTSAVSFSQVLPDLNGERQAWRGIGWALEQQAIARATQANPSHMVASGILKEAIRAYRKGRADKDEIDGLLERLREYQEQGLGELGSVRRDYDASTEVRAARECVAGQTFHSAMRSLAFIARLTDPELRKKQVLEHAKDFPLLYLLNTRVLDDAGRDRHIQRGILDQKPDVYATALKQRMFHDVQFEWNHRAQILIESARRQIMEEHTPRPQDMQKLIWENPFVPPGHEGLIMRGLLAGFYGDFVVASHLLALQFEACVRHVLESHGIHVANLLEDGSEPLKVWGGLLDIPETLEIFGPERLFELEGLLIHGSGYGYRNQLAHGMLTEVQCSSSIPAIQTWWLMLRLCMEQVDHRFTMENDLDAPQASA